jgi:hypothetical protein
MHAPTVASNVTLAGDTVPSATFELERLTVTLFVGLEFKRIVKVAVPPASVVFPLIADTV